MHDCEYRTVNWRPMKMTSLVRSSPRPASSCSTSAAETERQRHTWPTPCRSTSSASMSIRRRSRWPVRSAVDASAGVSRRHSALPFRSGAFDVVMTNKTLHHVFAWDALVAEMARVTRPGGHVIVSDLVAPRWMAKLTSRVPGGWRPATANTPRRRRVGTVESRMIRPWPCARVSRASFRRIRPAGAPDD